MLNVEMKDNKLKLSVEGDVATVIDELSKVNASLLVDIAKKTGVELEEVVEALHDATDHNIMALLVKDVFKDLFN